MIIAAFACLASGSASAQTFVRPAPADVAVMSQIRIAAANAAREDARLYLADERSRPRPVLIAAVDSRQLPLRSGIFVPRR